MPYTLPYYAPYCLYYAPNYGFNVYIAVAMGIAYVYCKNYLTTSLVSYLECVGSSLAPALLR